MEFLKKQVYDLDIQIFQKRTHKQQIKAEIKNLKNTLKKLRCKIENPLFIILLEFLPFTLVDICIEYELFSCCTICYKMCPLNCCVLHDESKKFVFANYDIHLTNKKDFQFIEFQDENQQTVWNYLKKICKKCKLKFDFLDYKHLYVTTEETESYDFDLDSGELIRSFSLHVWFDDNLHEDADIIVWPLKKECCCLDARK